MYFPADVWSPINFIGSTWENRFTWADCSGAVTWTLPNALVFRVWGVPVSLFYTSLGVRNKVL